MNDIDETELALYGTGHTVADRMARRIRELTAARDRLRAAMKRLEEWADELTGGAFGSTVGPAISEQLRNRIKAASNG